MNIRRKQLTRFIAKLLHPSKPTLVWVILLVLLLLGQLAYAASSAGKSSVLNIVAGLIGGASGRVSYVDVQVDTTPNVASDPEMAKYVEITRRHVLQWQKDRANLRTPTP